MKKSKVLCKHEYKGIIDDEVMHVVPGQEFHCHPSTAAKLLRHWPRHFDILDYEIVPTPVVVVEPKVVEEKAHIETNNKSMKDYVNKSITDIQE